MGRAADVLARATATNCPEFFTGDQETRRLIFEGQNNS
jgi:hypothetical protein